MSDNANLDPPSAPIPLPPQLPSLSPAQIASARDHWVGQGYSAEKFDVALNPSTEPEHVPAAPVTSLPPSFPMTNVQAREMADALLAAGVPSETVEAAMKADGLDPVPPSKTPEQHEHDKEFGFEREIAPAEYKIDYLSHGGRGVDPAQLAEVNAGATQWLADLRLDPAVGAALIERAMHVGQSLAKMSEAGRELFRREQRYAAERRLGGLEKLEAARALVAKTARLGDPVFTEILLRAGAFDDAWIFLTLANQGERLERWASGPAKATV